MADSFLWAHKPVFWLHLGPPEATPKMSLACGWPLALRVRRKGEWREGSSVTARPICRGCSCVKKGLQYRRQQPAPKCLPCVHTGYVMEGARRDSRNPESIGHYQRPDYKNRANARQIQDWWCHGYANNRWAARHDGTMVRDEGRPPS
jgi:hypothetical protein